MRTTRQIAADHWWSADHRLRTADIHSFIPDIYKAPLQETSSEALSILEDSVGNP